MLTWNFRDRACLFFLWTRRPWLGYGLVTNLAGSHQLSVLCAVWRVPSLSLIFLLALLTAYSVWNQHTLLIPYFRTASLTRGRGQTNLLWFVCTVLAIHFSWSFPEIPTRESWIGDPSLNTQRLDHCQLSQAKRGDLGLGVKEEQGCTRVSQWQLLTGHDGQRATAGSV